MLCAAPAERRNNIPSGETTFHAPLEDIRSSARSSAHFNNLRSLLNFPNKNCPKKEARHSSPVHQKRLKMVLIFSQDRVLQHAKKIRPRESKLILYRCRHRTRHTTHQTPHTRHVTVKMRIFSGESLAPSGATGGGFAGAIY